LRGLSFLVDGDLFAVDVTLVQKVARRIMVTPVPTAPEAVIGIANMKGSIVTVLSLYELLGRKERRIASRIPKSINAVVFKPPGSGQDQMGLSIDKPGALIEIDDDAVRQPTISTGTEEGFCISGLIVVDDKLYRLIDIDAIVGKYKNDGDTSAGIMTNGGTENNE